MVSAILRSNLVTISLPFAMLTSVGGAGCTDASSDVSTPGAHDDFAVAGYNGLSSINGLSSVSGLMTTADGRRTVAYIAKCALSSGDNLVKQDQNGATFTFPGSLGLAPQWKTGACDSNCQELVSACLIAHVNSYGVHYPLWLDSTGGSIGWGLPPSNYRREGTFFGNILVTGPMNHGSLSAPLGYYCEGPGVAGSGASLVAGRLGTANAQSAAPFYNAYLGSSCDWSNRCNAHKPDGVTVDGYNSCTD